ncbi:MAG: hypothetical protein J6M21_01700 [Campylobacter sp.]|nr:hypothetical protein [Campylobacter sp.]
MRASVSERSNPVTPQGVFRLQILKYCFYKTASPLAGLPRNASHFSQ